MDEGIPINPVDLVLLKKKTKRVKKKEPKKVEQIPRGATNGGMEILSFMRTHNVKGNFRDHVLFVGDRLIDNHGVYTFIREAKEGEDQKTVALVHKSLLHHIIGPSEASRFWDLKAKRREVHRGNPGLTKRADKAPT